MSHCRKVTSREVTYPKDLTQQKNLVTAFNLNVALCTELPHCKKVRVSSFFLAMSQSTR
jgi:hypothetical protein